MAMKKILIDTNIYSDAMRGKKYAVNILRRNVEILFSPVTVFLACPSFSSHVETRRRGDAEGFISFFFSAFSASLREANFRGAQNGFFYQVGAKNFSPLPFVISDIGICNLFVICIL
jgi:hypothetical protein